MTTELDPSEDIVERIASNLGPFHGTFTAPLNERWESWLKEYGEMYEFGEIRLAEDLENFPVGELIRVVYLVDEKGPVIR